MAGQDDLLERGFYLAYFIFPSRAVAIRILTDALNKLKAQRGRENRRAYWRDKYLKRGITRITREEGDALQWLIFFESDRYEREQESSNASTVNDLVIRYIKNLVRMTTAMSSFHVNVGLHRLLHNYSTAETQRTYETVTERFLGADEYRRAKSVLMTKLERRFDRFLKTQRTQHGELRFEQCADQHSWLELVEACLAVFTPWSTCQACPVPATFGPEKGQLLPQLSEASSAQLGRDRVEITRCHVFIDPVCYGRLATGLAMDAPEKRLAVPRFYMQNSKTEHPVPPPHPPALTGEERRAISDHLSAQSTRRRKAAGQFAKILVDGQERMRLDLTRRAESSFVITEGAEQIEIRTDDQGEDLLLATHPVLYAAEQGIAASHTTICLRGGKRLVVNVAPLAQEERATEDGSRQAVVRLIHEPNPFAAIWESRGAQRPRWRFALHYSAMVALLALGWVLGTRTQGNQSKVSTDNFVAPSQRPQPATPPAPQIIAGSSNPATYRLTPDDLTLRGAGGSDIPSVAVPSRPALIALELPIAAEDSLKPFRAVLRPFLKNTEILSAQLEPAKGAQPNTLVFWVPSAHLEANRDYMVVLQSRTVSGKREEAASYTFHTVATAK